MQTQKAKYQGIKLYLCLINHHTMKMDGEVEV